MIVIGDGVAVRDLAPYVAEMRATKLFDRFEGRYLLNSRAFEILEGESPQHRVTVLARYANRAAFEGFWNSEDYQQRVKPKRAHLPRMNVGLWRMREREVVPGAAAAYPCPPGESEALLLAHAPRVDTVRWAQYTAAIQASGIIPRHGGNPIVFGAPLAVVEGAFPADSVTIVLRFPCAQAARAFWYSDDYAEIRKLRDGAGDLVAGIWKLATS